MVSANDVLAHWVWPAVRVVPPLSNMPCETPAPVPLQMESVAREVRVGHPIDRWGHVSVQTLQARLFWGLVHTNEEIFGRQGLLRTEYPVLVRADPPSVRGRDRQRQTIVQARLKADLAGSSE